MVVEQENGDPGKLRPAIEEVVTECFTWYNALLF